MHIFMDSSALAKRHVLEPGTDRVLEVLTEARVVSVSVLAFPEIVAALNRRRREGFLDAIQYHDRLQDARDDMTWMSVIQLVDVIVDRTVVCLEQAPLRASDAVHVASAIELKVDLFVSADQRQCDAAEAMGLPVERIAL